MSEPSPRRRVALGVALAAVAVTLFFATCEKQQVELPRGYAGEAARNRYLAAEILLDRMGMPAKSFGDVGALASLPSETGTLIVPTPRRSLDAATSARLLDWVDRGGHLVVLTWELWDDPKRNPDPILDSVGVHQFLNRDDSGGGEDAPPPEGAAPSRPSDAPDPEASPDDEGDGNGNGDADAGDDADGDANGDDADAPDVAEADFPDRDTPLEVRFDPRFRLDMDDPESDSILLEIGDDAGSHWLTLRHGKGLITGLSDDYFMTQPEIGDLDHAELVYRMSRLGGHRGPVWFVYGDQHPSVLQLVARHGWMVAASALALLLLWLWSASRRFGPLTPEPARARRELMEHVRAAGLLQWRRGGGGALLAATRDAVLARMRERHPGFESLAPDDQVRRLETLSGLPRERLADALAFQAESDPGRFAAKIAILEKLRRSL
ncbi:MAG: DUF4350 domain-containing protein [Myxococcota bacterium]